MSFDYFRVLLVHPLPEPDESLSSYINRLMHANGMNPSGFGKVLGHESTMKRKKQLDYTALNTEKLAEITSHSAALLAEHTLTDFMAKFVRTTATNQVKGFLSDVLAPYQRYCPLCLREKQVYKLPWRFNLLECCHVHQCELLDVCCHCGAEIGFLSAANGFCASCGGQCGM